MFKKLKSLNYKNNVAGNLSIFLALSMPVMLVAVGTAVDMADTTSRKTSLQSATDISVLAAAKSGERKSKDLEKAAREAFNLNFEFKKGESLKKFDVKVLGSGELSLQTQIIKPTTIMGLFGQPVVGISTEAATYLPSDTPLDIALVLDRTGSMAGANIAGLITASDDFISKLKLEGRDIRMSVISSSSTTTTSSSSSSGCTTTTTTTSSGGSSSTSTTSSCTPSGGWGDVSRTSSGGYCTLSTSSQEDSGSLVEECTPVVRI